MCVFIARRSIAASSVDRGGVEVTAMYRPDGPALSVCDDHTRCGGDDSGANAVDEQNGDE